MGRRTRIVVADDQPLIRTSLAELLNAHAEFEVVGEAEDGAAAVELTGRLQPDVVVMDSQMPNLNGAEATRAILSKWPAVHVVAHSWHDNAATRRALLEAGAVAFVGKSGSISSLLDAIRQAASRGGDKNSPGVAPEPA